MPRRVGRVLRHRPICTYHRRPWWPLSRATIVARQMSRLAKRIEKFGERPQDRDNLLLVHIVADVLDHHRASHSQMR